MKKPYILFAFIFLPVFFLTAQSYDVPEILYYKFDTGTTTTPNYAVPGAGTNPATLLNMTMGPGGQFDNALLGNGGTGTTTHVNSGWNMDVGASSWTISVWMSNFPTSSSTTYLFGNDITTSFRCFTNGAAGNTNITLRGTGITNVNVLGVLPGPSVVHFVYDSSASEVRVYVNGAFQSAVTQVPLNINAAVPFKVGSYGTASSIPVGTMLDEFRFYRRALGVDEIAATWNQTLPYVIPVELTSFTASVIGTNVNLNWTTASETNNNGFEIEKSLVSETNWEKIAFVPGFGTTTEAKTYSFSEENVSTGVYKYRLRQTDFDGTFEYSNEIEVVVTAPVEYALEQNYPNPFNPATQIKFSIPEAGFVKMEVYNLVGEKVATLINKEMNSGYHTIDFNAEDISSGVYVYTLSVNDFVTSKKMILMK
jgi:hypothetical protein